MEADFWLERWRSGQIGFHQAEINAALRSHWGSLRVPAGAKVFVPLCGKSRDMAWLRGQGHPVVGVELSRIAVRDFFAENGLKPTVSTQGRFERWEAEGVTLLCGDLFDLEPADLAGVAGVYDRASLVALPPEMRPRYAEAMRRVLPDGARMLLLTWSYPDGEMAGPPFSVAESEVRRLYADAFDVELLSRAESLAQDPELRRRGLTSLVENVFAIRRSRAPEVR